MTEPQLQTNSNPSRRWAFRCLAICIGLSPFFFIELACRSFGWGKPDPTQDPYVGFSAIKPLFEKDHKRGRYVLSPARAKFFANEEFLLEKPANGLRIFCLGGSTVQGRPYSTQTSFTTWLELALQQIDSTREFEVINCGGISYASYRLLPIMQECLNYQPDVFIVCTGHNEFLEDREYAHLKNISPRQQSLEQWGKHFRTVNVVQQWLNAKPPQTVLSEDVQARLDYQHGLEKFHRDPTWAIAVQTHFASNLQVMISRAQQANVPILFINPCSNLAGQPPFKDEPNAALSPEQQATVEVTYQSALKLIGTQPQEAYHVLKEVCHLDSEFASAWYQRGQSELALNRIQEARESFIKARDADVCPLRMTTPLETSLREITRVNQVPMLDAHALLEAQAVHQILGSFWLVDHVHPSISGHQQIALALADELLKILRLPKTDAWKPLAKEKFAEHLDSLPRTYFHRGQRILESLKGWTRGQAKEL